MDNKEKCRQYRINRGIKEFDEIFDSMEHIMREKLVGLDSNIRQITMEARMSSVPNEVIKQRLQDRFWSLFQHVAQEGVER